MLIAVCLFIGLSLLLASTSSDELLLAVGAENAYFIMFVLAVVGGLTTFTGVPYHFILMSFAAGGLNPVLLGVTTAGGVMIGDSASYFLGKQGEQVLPTRFKTALESVGYYLHKYPRAVTPFLLVYGTISPFSNDFIMISTGLVQYSYWRVIIPLSIGNTFYNIGLALIGYYAFDSFQAFFSL